MNSSQGLKKMREPDDDIREALDELPYGVYIIGSSDGETPNAMIADWVMQISFKPRLLLVSFEKDASSLSRIRKHRFFTVNLLNQENNGMALAARFVQPANTAKIKGRRDQDSLTPKNKLDGIEYRIGEHAVACPILEDALAFLECEAREFVDAGDHVLAIGSVLYGEVQQSGEPLTSTYTGWTYAG